VRDLDEAQENGVEQLRQERKAENGPAVADEREPVETRVAGYGVGVVEEAVDTGVAELVLVLVAGDEEVAKVPPEVAHSHVGRVRSPQREKAQHGAHGQLGQEGHVEQGGRGEGRQVADRTGNKDADVDRGGERVDDLPV